MTTNQMKFEQKKKAIKKLLTATLLTAAIFTGSMSAGDIPHAQAYMITCQEERNVGYNAYNEYLASHKYYKDKDLSSFYRLVVATNSDKLNFDDGRHKRWVNNDVVVVDNGELNAYMYPGGYMAFTKEELDFCSSYCNDGYTGSDKKGWRTYDDGLYAGGRLLSVMCHEFGHYINEDYLKTVDKNMKLNYLSQIISVFSPGTTNAALAQLGAAFTVQSMVERGYSRPDENDADDTALDLMNNMAYYGVGDVCSYRFRSMNLSILNGKNPKKDSKTHPAPFKRFKKAQDYIKNISDGKVKLRNYSGSEMKKFGRYADKIDNSISKNEYVMEINGKLFNEALKAYPAGYALGNNTGLAQDRTFHIAGQIAGAVEKGVFKKANIRYISTAAMHDRSAGSDRQGYVYISAKNKRGRTYRLVIDRVDVDEETFKKAVKSGPDCTYEENRRRYSEMSVIKGIYDAAKD